METRKIKWILHIDFDSFFASVEQQNNPEFVGKPLGVTGGVGDKVVDSATIVASSKEAKRIGIKTGTRVGDAKKLYPGIILRPPNFDRYSTVHRFWQAVLRPFSPTIEIFSIDEAFLDITHWIKVWGKTPKAVGQEIKNCVRRKLGDVITASVGIATNKTMAKLATGFGKPDGLTILYPKDHKKALKEVPPDKLCGVGFRLLRRLYPLGVSTAWDIGQIPEHKLRKHFGIYGRTLHQMGRGVYNEDLNTAEPFPKSIGHSKVLYKITYKEEAEFFLRQLCEMVAHRTRKLKAKGNIVWAAASDSQFHRFGRQVKLPDYTSDGLTIFEEAKKLIPDSGTRFLAVSLCGIIYQNAVTLSLFENQIRRFKALRAVDELILKYGRKIFNLKPGGENKKLIG